jgi:S-layer protein
MAILTKNEKYIVEMYVRYFGKAPSVAEIAKYNEFGEPKLILTEIIGDADDSNAGLTTEEFVNNAFQNLFGRDATTKEMNKYSKVVDKGEDLPINAIVKAAKKSDKGVYEAKKAIAIMLAEKDNATIYNNLDKITKDTYAKVYDLKAKKLLVDSVAELKTKIDAMKDNVSGTTFNLTTSVDTKVGSDKGDLFEGIVGGSATLTALDSIDGKEGKDTLNILNAASAALELPAGLVVKNVEIVNVKSAHDVGVTGAGKSFDVSGFTGLTDLNITQAKDVFLTAAATTDVNVSGATGAAVNVDGGKNVVVNDATVDQNITIGATTGAAGTITVTDTKQGTGVINVDGGTDVTITANADLDLNSSFVAVDTNTNGNLLDAVDYVPVLKTVTITGAGDVDLGDLSSVNTFTTLTASAATGDISASVDGSCFKST